MTYLTEAHAEITKARAANDKLEEDTALLTPDHDVRKGIREERWRITDRLIALAAIDARVGVIDIPFPPDMDTP